MPTRGVDQDSGPLRVPPAKAPSVKNFLMGRDGRLRMRGPSTNGLFQNAFFFPCSIIPSRRYVLVCFRDANATRYVEPWQQRIVQAGAANLAQSRAATAASQPDLYDFAVLACVPNAALARQLTPGRKYAQWNNVIYAPAYDSIDNTVGAAANGIILQNGVNYRRTALLKWVMTTPATNPVLVTAVSGNPWGAVDIKFFAGRMFLAGGALYDGVTESTFYTNHLWFSSPMTTATFPAAGTDWKDPVTGAYNTILVGDDGLQDAVIALARAQRYMLAFKRNSTHIITGSGPATFSTRVLAPDIGCIDPSSICEIGDNVFWLSQHGFMLWDGAQIANVGIGVESTAFKQARINTERGMWFSPDTTSFVSATRLDNENVLVTIARSGMNNFAVWTDPSPGQIQDYQAIFNIRRRDWIQVSTYSDQSLNGQWGGSAGAILTQASPEADFVYGYGLVDNTPTYTMNRIDKWTAPENTNWSAFQGTDGTRSIPLEWKSPLVQLAAPPQKATLRRLILEYHLQHDKATAGFYVTVTNEDGTVLIPEFQVPNTNGSTALYSVRAYTDIPSEASAVQVKVRWDGLASTAGRASKAEIYGCWIEFQGPAQQPHT